MVAKNRSTFIAPAILLLVCLFLLQRGGLLLFGCSHIAHPAFDETASGVLACDLLDGGLRAPLLAYQYEARSGDGLIEGFLLAPFFIFFGRSLLSFKLCPLASSLVTLLCWILLLRRYYGVWAAALFAALFTLPPPMFARLGLMGTIASHHLINPIAALQLLCLFRITEGGDGGTGMRWWLGLGLLSALGTYAFYTFIILSAFCLLFLVLAVPVRVAIKGMPGYVLGFAAGAVPWALRSISSPAGGRYLSAILENIRLDGWSFIQNFFFNLPHSLGYGYPAKEMSVVSVLFVLFLAACGLFIARSTVPRGMDKAGGGEGEMRGPAYPAAPALFFLSFPIFFLLCLSLSPMKIAPFEYWPSIGFFGYFSVSDVYRYRWLHLLYPFYFAIAAAGITGVLRGGRVGKGGAAAMGLLLVFFLVCGAAGALRLCSRDDYKRLLCYKGYSYDQMSTRFLLSDVSPLMPASRARLVGAYPGENLGEVYRCLGTDTALRAIAGEEKVAELEGWLKNVPPSYLADAVYGIVRAAQHVSEDAFEPVGEAVADMQPRIFYTQWGYRHLGYKHYGFLLNRDMIVASIPAMEKWFFRNFLQAFERQLSGSRGNRGKENLLRDLDNLPGAYQLEAVKGIGMLVGAEMCFDPRLEPDYPLDSRKGELFEGVAREAFYEGVGMGFAETLGRFQRALLLPAEPSSPLCRKPVERERCRSLLRRMASPYTGCIERGFHGGKPVAQDNFIPSPPQASD